MSDRVCVTVIIPTYNCAVYLPHAIDSVLSQTIKDLELIIIDDASEDGTGEVVARYSTDRRVRYHRQKERLGPSAARNKGIDLAGGEFIAFLDADDYWEPENLQAQLEALSSSEAGVSCVGAQLHTEHGRKAVVKQPPFGGDEFYMELLFRNSLPASSSGIVIRKDCFKKVGTFDERLFAVEDRDLWVRLAGCCNFVFVGKPLTHVNRRRDDSAVRDNVRMAQGCEAFLKKREEDMPPRFRQLLPRLRRRYYLKIARYYQAASDERACRKYCVRALASSMALDDDLRRAVSVLLRSFFPAGRVARRRTQSAALA